MALNTRLVLVLHFIVASIENYGDKCLTPAITTLEDSG